MIGSLTAEQKRQLAHDGFLPSEILAYSRAVTPTGQVQALNYDSQTFSMARKSRREWVKQLLNEGWSTLEIKEQVNQYYKKNKSKSPFDWLKLEYQPAKKIVDFQSAMATKKRAIRRSATRQLGYGYGRKLRRKPYKRKVAPARPNIRAIRGVK